MSQDPLFELAKKYGGRVVDPNNPPKPERRLRIFINSNAPWGL